ncbi:protein jagged-1-like [Haliotis rubra]|uniref:protein jagged-1-like n=1 Tax=Haliotis rubra TaxID=36100 RepID=UPI001EE5244F|nr:protein jagged-1-like [Haliotis rubra]
MKTRALLLWLLIIRHVKTDGKLDIRFISYWSDGKENSGRCCDNELPDWCRNKCDPMFYLRIDGQDGRKPRSLYKTTTHHTENHNIIHFGSTIRGTPNPFIIQVPKALPSSIEIMVQVDDYDDISGDDHMDTLSKLININAAHTEQAAMYTPYTLSRRTELKIAVRAYCDPDWYGSACERHCKATPDHSHYTCHPYTGAKMCFEGWKGNNCNQDIDECTETDQICQHGGNCTNSLGSFECICVEGVNGTQCENIINQCALEPCLNGGTCDGNETDFSCACPVEWIGEACADKVNFCDSSPCNMGHCTPDLLTAPRFKCDCDFAWVGEKCSQSVDIVNITLLGEIGHTNRGDLADGLNRFITELGGIPGTVYNKYKERKQIDSLARIFESNPDEIINEYLPLPLYPPREEEKATLKVTPTMPTVLANVSLLFV